MLGMFKNKNKDKQPTEKTAILDYAIERNVRAQQTLRDKISDNVDKTLITFKQGIEESGSG